MFVYFKSTFSKDKWIRKRKWTQCAQAITFSRLLCNRIKFLYVYLLLSDFLQTWQWQHGIQATSATYTTAHGTEGSLTHWAVPGIEPTSSWILVRFVNHWATMGTPGAIYWAHSFGLELLRALHTFSSFKACSHWMTLVAIIFLYLQMIKPVFR